MSGVEKVKNLHHLLTCPGRGSGSLWGVTCGSCSTMALTHVSHSSLQPARRRLLTCSQLSFTIPLFNQDPQMFHWGTFNGGNRKESRRIICANIFLDKQNSPRKPVGSHPDFLVFSFPLLQLTVPWLPDHPPPTGPEPPVRLMWAARSGGAYGLPWILTIWRTRAGWRMPGDEKISSQTQISNNNKNVKNVFDKCFVLKHD